MSETLTIHAVPVGTGSLIADCGQQLGVGNHTGHHRPLRALDGHRVCEMCADPVAALRKVLDQYFDFDVDSWDDTACPEPEDVWRLHRDLKTLLQP